MKPMLLMRMKQKQKNQRTMMRQTSRKQRNLPKGRVKLKIRQKTHNYSR